MPKPKPMQPVVPPLALPVKANAGSHDTQDMYKQQKVSYGTAYKAPLSDGTKIQFEANRLTTATRIDERNLKECIYLHQNRSSIT